MALFRVFIPVMLPLFIPHKQLLLLLQETYNTPDCFFQERARKISFENNKFSLIITFQQDSCEINIYIHEIVADFYVNCGSLN